MSKYIIVTGGVITNLGKGTTAASLGRLLKNRGVKVTMQKFNPYLNVDPGTMSPYQHGEVFVTDDGTETDLDIGHYERFLDINLGKMNDISGGILFSSVINKERLGKYVGSTVSIVPHVTTEVKECILANEDKKIDVVIVEIGGTINDEETNIYLQGVRQLISEIGSENVFILHVDYLPLVEATGETKIEPVQNSIQKLNSYGISPDAVVCRTQKNTVLDNETKARIARRCFVKDGSCIAQVPDLETVYEIPTILQKEGLDDIILKKFKMNAPKADLKSWDFMVYNFKSDYTEVKFSVVGKYTKVPDAYISVEEAIKHACAYNQIKPVIEYIDAEDIEEVGADKLLRGTKAIIIPAGWGNRGFNGMIEASRYARENKIPFLGLGFGLQAAVVDLARNVLEMKKANTTEIDPNTDYPVIDIMAEQKALVMKNGTNRLGSYKCVLDPKSKVAKLYGKDVIEERHRHRYEINGSFSEKLEQAGLQFAGMNPESKLIDIIELQNHPFFVGVNFQPEFKSKPYRPHPIFLGLVNTAKSVR